MIRKQHLSLSISILALGLAAAATGCGGGDEDPGNGSDSGDANQGGDGDDSTGMIDLGTSGGRPLDADGDGVPDGIDTNGDGIADHQGVGIDLDGNGTYEGLDVDGDGVIDYEFATPGSGLVSGCNDLQVEFETVIPTVLLLVDRSSSMFDLPLDPFPNRWEPLKEALVGDDGAVTTLQGGIRFGFSAYTHQSANGVAACPLFNATSIGLDNYAAIKAEYDAVSFDPIDPNAAPVGGVNPTKGETPTGAAINAAAAVLASFTEAGPKFILLVTDGEPDTCESPDPQCGQDEAIAATQAAYEQGIGTFAIGVGDIGVPHLQQLANAGTGQPVAGPAQTCGGAAIGTYSETGGTARVFNPGDPDALKADIAGIVGSVRSCTYTMNEEVDLEKANLGSVLINGAGVTYEDANGWRMNSATEIEILGASCETIKTTVNPDVFISFPCDSFVK